MFFLRQWLRYRRAIVYHTQRIYACRFKCDCPDGWRFDKMSSQCIDEREEICYEEWDQGRCHKARPLELSKAECCCSEGTSKIFNLLYLSLFCMNSLNKFHNFRSCVGQILRTVPAAEYRSIHENLHWRHGKAESN